MDGIYDEAHGNYAIYVNFVIQKNSFYNMFVTYCYLPLCYTIFACFYNIRNNLTKMHLLAWICQVDLCYFFSHWKWFFFGQGMEL